MWKGQHGTVLPDSWPLVVSLQLKLWKGVAAEPPAVETLLLEQLRLMTDVSKPMGTDLNVIPGKSDLHVHRRPQRTAGHSLD